MENRELERAHAKFEASIVPPLPSFNQPPASAQTAQFEPTDSPKQNPCPVPEVDSKAKPRHRSRPPVRGRARTLGPPKVDLKHNYSSCDRTSCCSVEESPGGNVFSEDDKKRPSGGSGPPEGGGGGDEPPPPNQDDKQRGKSPSFKAPGDDDDDPDDDDEWDDDY